MKPTALLKIFQKSARALLAQTGVQYMNTLPGAAEALLATALATECKGPVVWIGDGLESLEAMHRDLMTLAPGMRNRIAFYPPHDVLPDAEQTRHSKARTVDPDITGFRLQTLRRLASNTEPDLITTCVQAMMQRVAPPDALSGRLISLELRSEVDDLEALRTKLLATGYVMNDDVQEKGDMAMRGGLFDVWPATEDWPLRLEFVGPVVESIRAFDPATQRSTGLRDRADLTPITEAAADVASFLDYLPDNAVLLWSGMERIEEHAGLYEETTQGGTDNDQEQLRDGSSRPQRESPTGAASTARGLGLIPLVYLVSEVDKRGWLQVQLGEGLSDRDGSSRLQRDLVIDAVAIPSIAAATDEPWLPDFMEQARGRLIQDLKQQAAAGRKIVLYCDSTGSRDYFSRIIGDSKLDVRVGLLSAGFSSEVARLTVVAESDLYARRKRLGRRYDPRGDQARAPRAGTPIHDLGDIESGDFVVHVDHGIGRYLGLSEIIFDGQPQEVLTLEYADDAKLHVPVGHIHLLTRYVPVSKHRVKLHRIGGQRWGQERAHAEKAIEDMASGLLETQAARSLEQGFAFPADTAWQREFEASFPYVDTPDQATASAEIKQEMESPKVMDRLICGDAGYGKTEVAMRAAFKVVMSEKQVAVLVPTTVLAQQHFDTFRERMSAYPVRIEMLSRFRTPGQQQQIFRDMKEGKVDIVIGTHALLRANIAFHDLGLVVIDEEQRFGVVHKEFLKHVRRTVDVLTLSATPIPRTLYMSMVGIRDMSLLKTPPRERLTVETVVTDMTDKVVRDAILRELNREGQVFYVHNRVMSIDVVRRHLEKLVPEARIRVAHGQMPAGELGLIMKAFINGEFDVLLCTTIIESGMDIPRANTILIDRADRFGVADLYQLRGRVGRSNRKAYAYLLLPVHGGLDSDVRRRISAIKQYSASGSSFKLALQDLELRGAGNLLGAAQSGHINAIGFGLYCQLLKRTVAIRKGERPKGVVDISMRLDFLHFAADPKEPGRCAYIPYEFVEDERHRIGLYRRMAEAATIEDVRGLEDEIEDRFGAMPDAVRRLLLVSELRVVAANRKITSIETDDGKIVFMRGADYMRSGNRFPRAEAESPTERLKELIRLANTVDRWNG